MAYNAEKEVKNTLIDITKNKRGDVVRLASVTDESGNVSYDIRNMYVMESGDLGFTSKGIRLKKDMVVDIIPALMKDLDSESYNKIIEALNSDNKPENS